MFSHIAIVGIGNMGSAMADRLISQYPSSHFYFYDSKDENLAPYKSEARVHGSTSFDESLKKAEVVIIAVKPQGFADCAEKLEDYLGENCIPISVMAGVSANQIENDLGLKRSVRSMPNLPLKVAAGLIAYYVSGEFSETEKKNVDRLLDSFGMTLIVDEEDKLNAITALSGSGPAYFFKLAEEIQNAAEGLGFEKSDASKIVAQTFFGSAKLADKEGKSFAELGAAITSKGGTTEAALAKFDEGGLGSLVTEAIGAALNRSEELSS